MMLLWRAFFLMLLVLLSWFGWHLYTQQQLALVDLQQQQKTLSQQLGDLNDRLVAVARLQTPAVGLMVAPDMTAAEQTEFLRQNIRQSLLLAQAALEDGRQEDADALLLSVQAVLNGTAQPVLAPALAQGLRESIQADRLHLGENAQLRQTARRSMDRALQQIQQQLGHMAEQGPKLYTSAPAEQLSAVGTSLPQTELKTQQDWINRVAQMVSLRRVSLDEQVSLSQRALLCREVALTVGLARHAVRQQQPDQLRALLGEAVRQMSRLPDADAVQMRQWLEQLLAAPLPSAPPLKALALLPERTAS